MPRIKSKAFQLRKQLELREGRRIPLSEVAKAAGVDRMALTRLEDGKTERFDGDVLARLCVFYGVDVEDMLELDPNKRRPAMQPAL